MKIHSDDNYLGQTREGIGLKKKHIVIVLYHGVKPSHGIFRLHRFMD